MPRVPTMMLPVLAVALWPVQGHAQEGPSFDCRYAQTATEHAICASPDLSALERQMYASYLNLVDALGERKARRIADRFLERRQACGNDESCIAQRLAITQRVFERRAGGDTQLASREPTDDELSGEGDGLAPASTAAPTVEEEVASATLAPLDSVPLPRAREDIAPASPPVVAEAAETAPGEDLAPTEPPVEEQVASADPVDPDLPLAAQAPLPSDLDPLLNGEDRTAAGDVSAATVEEAVAPDAAPPAAGEQVASAEPPPPVDPIGDAIAGAELTSSDTAAPFDQPISWAFMDLIRHQRADIQARLQAAGYYDGPAQGSWDQATLRAFDAFFASEEGQGFDPSTENGAALALDFIRSDTFAEAHGVGATAPEPSDPVASEDW